MQKILCFISHEMADFEVTLACHLLKAIGGREIVTVGYEPTPVISQAGFTYLPQCILLEALDFDDIEGLIIPGGPIRPQQEALTAIIQRLDAQEKLLAAICFGPQYLGRAGILDRHTYTTSCMPETIRSLQVPDPFPRGNCIDQRVVRDGHVITAKGAAFVDFAFAICDYLDIFAGRGAERADRYAEIMNK